MQRRRRWRPTGLPLSGSPAQRVRLRRAPSTRWPGVGAGRDLPGALTVLIGRRQLHRGRVQHRLHCQLAHVHPPARPGLHLQTDHRRCLQCPGQRWPQLRSVASVRQSWLAAVRHPDRRAGRPVPRGAADVLVGVALAVVGFCVGLVAPAHGGGDRRAARAICSSGSSATSIAEPSPSGRSASHPWTPEATCRPSSTQGYQYYIPIRSVGPEGVGVELRGAHGRPRPTDRSSGRSLLAVIIAGQAAGLPPPRCY